MVRNVIALIAGILAFYLLHGLIFWILVSLGIIPFKGFLSAIEGSNPTLFFDLAEKILKIEVFLAFPISSLLVGGIVGIMGKNKQYWVAAAAVCPHYVAYAYPSLFFHSIYSFFTFFGPTFLGVFVVRAVRYRGSSAQ